MLPVVHFHILMSFVQVDDSEQEIEPEIFYLDYNQISNMVVEKRIVQLFQAHKLHPCIEKFFSESPKSLVNPISDPSSLFKLQSFIDLRHSYADSYFCRHPLIFSLKRMQRQSHLQRLLNCFDFLRKENL